MNKEEIKEYAKKEWVPIIRDQSAIFLCDYIRSHKPKTILEIGTAIGYSGILMLENSQATLTTIEINKESFNLAKQNFCDAGFEKRVKMFCDDAKNVFGKLEEKFDLIFLDGPKGQYLTYLPILKNLLNDGGTLVVDDVFYHGWVKGNDYPSHKHRTIILRMREFLKRLCEDKDFDTKIYDIEDGIAVARLKR